MMDTLLMLCNLLALFIFLYTTAGLAITGTAELVQLAILGRGKPPEGLQEGEIRWLLTPPVVSGIWLSVAWWFGMGTGMLT